LVFSIYLWIMNRGWSTENLVGMAASGFTRIRKMLRPAGDGDDAASADLLALCRRMDERAKQGMHTSTETFTQCFEGFVNEVRHVVEGTDIANPHPAASNDNLADISSQPPDERGAKTKLKRSQENGISAFFDALIRLPPATLEQYGVRAMVDYDVLGGIFHIHANASGLFTRKLIDGATACLLHVLCTQPALITHSAEAFHAAVQRRVAGDSPLPSSVVPLLRTLLLWGEVLRRADISAPELANEAKALWAHLGAMDLLCTIVERSYTGAQDRDATGRTQTAFYTLGVVGLSVLSGLFRSNVPIKMSILASPACERLVAQWAYFSSNIDRMQLSAADVVPSPMTGKPEEHSVTCESAAVWGSEMTGFILELCTSNSFSLQRQLAFVDDTQQMPLVVAQPAGASNPAVHAVPTAGTTMPRWEHIPTNWDTLLGSAVVIPWRVASALATCCLSVDSAKVLLRGTAALDLAEPTSDFILRATFASLLCLCRANPQNVTVLHQAGAVPTLIRFMAPGSDVIPVPAGTIEPAPRSEGSQDAWPISSALLTLLLSFVMGPSELQLIMGAIENMVHQPPSRDDCDSVETCLAILVSSTYPHDFFWFNGSAAHHAIAPLEKICGRWYGYSFSAWVSPVCVWPEGSMLFSIRDANLTSALALCIVATGRQKCLAVKSATSRDQFSMVQLPDAVIGDRWHHIAAVHNIGGFTVYVDGRKCGSGSVTYPKEPPKPHRLSCTVGMGDRELQISPFFGMMAGVELIDGVLSETSLEKIVAAGVGSSAIAIDALVAEKQLVVLTALPENAAGLQGSLIKDEAGPSGVTRHAFPNVAESLVECDTIGWTRRVIHNLGVSTNRSSVAILTLELLAGMLQQRGEAGLQAWIDGKVTQALGAELCAWDTTQPEVLSALFALVMDGSTKRFRDHPTTAEILRLLFDLVLLTSAESRGATLREISEHLDEPSNAAFFNQHVGVGVILQLAHNIENGNVSEYAHAVEKVVRQPAELDAVLRFVLTPAGSPEQSISGRLAVPRRSQYRAPANVVKGELLRMIYEVAKARPTLLDMLAQANGVQVCLAILNGEMHDSEPLRVISLRIIALILHTNKKVRETFQRAGHFDTIASAILAHSRHAPIGLPTFNALFKFALDFYRPSTSDDAAVLTKLRDSPARPVRKAHADPVHLHGHTPSMAQVRPLMCRAHSITSVGSSEVSDVDARLSMDDGGDGTNRDTLVHPHCIQIVFRLLEPIAVAAAGADVGDRDENLDAGIGPDLPTSVEHAAAVVVLHRVLRYLHRMVELSHNAAALVPYPWLDWIWGVVAPLTPPGTHTPSAAGPKVESTIRAIIRVITVTDMSRSRTKQSMTLKRVRDMVDAPALQQLVLEELVRNFTTHHRLDTMDAEDAAAVLRNLAEGAFTNIEDAVVPLPLSLGLEMVRAVETIAVNNTIWVRQKMKTFRSFELRDRLALHLLASCRGIANESVEAREALRIATQQDPNASLVVLKQMCDAARERDDERFDALQDLLRRCFASDEDHRRAITRAIGDPEMLERLVNERKVVDGAEVRAECFVLWITRNEALWEPVAQRIVKAAKSVDADFAARAEKRDKEYQAKLRARKQEMEKRTAAVNKQWSDAEKTFAELVFKASAAHTSAIAAVEKDREARLDVYAAAATTTMST
jgi:hypothetical protein